MLSSNKKMKDRVSKQRIRLSLFVVRYIFLLKLYYTVYVSPLLNGKKKRNYDAII